METGPDQTGRFCGWFFILSPICWSKSMFNFSLNKMLELDASSLDRAIWREIEEAYVQQWAVVG
jgi:hypothetical protein